MTSPDFASLPQPVGVVAHDAGAANLLAAWVAEAELGPLQGCLAGPASAIFARSVPGLQSQPLAELVGQCRTIISGTGWASDLEHESRLSGRQAGCLNIAVIDHWTDYRARFVRSGQEVLPDAIWVADADALRLAQSEFPGLAVTAWPNAYLRGQAAAVSRREPDYAERASHVLYLLEPIRDDWGPLPVPGEFMALDYFVQHLAALALPQPVRLRLRPHPSDPHGKYDAWLQRNAALRPELDASSTLEEALAWSGTVAGCQTYAMVVALAAGRRVVCTIPPGRPACALPQAGIVRLAQLDA